VQSPAWHTLVPPQPVPLGAGRAVSTLQVAAPVAQLVCHEVQEPAGAAQGTPAVHATQLPARHTWSAPQAVPSGARIAVSAQDGVGAQVRAPSVQAAGDG